MTYPYFWITAAIINGLLFGYNSWNANRDSLAFTYMWFMLTIVSVAKVAEAVDLLNGVK